MYADGVLGIENRVFVLMAERLDIGQPDPANVTDLTSGVDDVTIVFDALVNDAFGKGTLNGWIVSFYEVVFYKLDNKGGFPWGRLGEARTNVRGRCLPTEREPRTAIFLFLIVLAAMSEWEEEKKRD